MRATDDHLNVTKELACSQPMKRTVTGTDLFFEFKQGLASLNLTINELCNITTNGAPKEYST